MGLQQNIEDDFKQAMKSKDSVRMDVLRMIKTEIKNKEIEKREPVTDEDIIAILSRLQKQHLESISLYEKGNRKDLMDKEKQELEIIQSYLPKQLSKEELLKLIDTVIQEVGATTIKDMGKVMGAIMPRVKGKADGKTVQNLVREKLS